MAFSARMTLDNSPPEAIVVSGFKSVGANALLRFYVWHCIAIPLIASVLMGLHFWRVRKDGFSRPHQRSSRYSRDRKATSR